MRWLSTLLLFASTASAQVTSPIVQSGPKPMAAGVVKTPRPYANYSTGLTYTDDAANNRYTLTVPQGAAGIYADAPLSGTGTSASHLSCPTCFTTAGGTMTGDITTANSATAIKSGAYRLGFSSGIAAGATPAMAWNTTNAFSTNVAYQWSDNGTPRMHLTGAGNLGVGIATPQNLVHIYGTLKVGGAANQDTGVVALGDDASSGNFVGIFRAANRLVLAGYAGINFASSTAIADSQVVRMSILNDGSSISPGATNATTFGTSALAWKRIFVDGTASVSGDYTTLGAGWGSTASIGTITGADSHGRFTITTGGSGIAASPTVVYTFHDGTWTAAPWCSATIEATSDSAAQLDHVVTQVSTATTLTLTWNGTPVTANTYTIQFFCQG